jgi:quercetin dioxygenase-like cupin family protein
VSAVLRAAQPLCAAAHGALAWRPREGAHVGGWHLVSRALFPLDEARKVAFYELRLRPQGRDVAEPHPAGTTENLVVSAGSLRLLVDAEKFSLEAGDAVFFEADVPHERCNPGDRDVVMYLVMNVRLTTLRRARLRRARTRISPNAV